MYRRGGIIAIGAGLILVVLFLLWPARIQTGWVRSGGEVTTTYVQCGLPYSILTEGRFGEGARTPWTRRQCELASRTRLLNIAVVSGPLLAFGIAGILRGRYRRVPLTDILRPLPTRHRRRRRPD